MKKASLWFLAVVFCCSLVMNSCSDDFFMHCIGTWWKNTAIDPKAMPTASRSGNIRQ